MSVETKTVSTLVLEVPGAISIFEELGIDYCCGGKQSLRDACSEKGLNLTAVTQSLERARKFASSRQQSQDWTKTPLRTLIDHIVGIHHTFTRRQLQLLKPLVSKVLSVHGETHSELQDVQHFFRALEDELSAHMMKEERVLFPYVRDLETADEQKAQLPPAGFGSVRNPIQMMVSEHDAAGQLLQEIRKVTSDFSLPEEACTSYQALFQELQVLEKDLHRHIHLENNILFPRAIGLENQFAAQAPAGDQKENEG